MEEYIIDAFTREGENTNLEVNNLTVGCISSKKNKFEVDSEGNITAKSISVEDIKIATQVVLDVMYPVGAIFMSMNSVNPSTIYGGEWEQIKDTFLLACGDKYEVNQTGGEETHKLTIEEMPSHNHSYDIKEMVPNGGSMSIPVWANTGTIVPTTRNTGGGQSHNNMPPYLVVYMWKRVG